MSYSFYQTKEYKEKQSNLTKANWRKGLFDVLYKRTKKHCKRKGCVNVFEVKPSDEKIYCSRSCAASVVNVGRGSRPIEVRLKISSALRGRAQIYPSPFKGKMKVPRTEMRCFNPLCRKAFFFERYKNRKFCSNQCAMGVIGGKPTSPRASRGKAGIRKDISSTIYFYSRWEANMARLYTYLGVKWIYAPTSFDLKGQTYTPDFYLPQYNTYIEVKNFWWKYSVERDRKFRKLYPTLKLEVILKKDYLEIEKEYSSLIENWEYRNSPFAPKI